MPGEDDAPRTYHIIVEGLEFPWRVGVYDHEYDRPQTLRISLDLTALEPPDPEADNYATVPCYDSLCRRIRELAGQGHVRLIETLAHRIALLALEQDPRITAASVRVEKPGAIDAARLAGVIITRRRSGGRSSRTL